MTSDVRLVGKCLYRQAGVFCSGGYLYHADTVSPAIVDEGMIQCPACEGKGAILTDTGREMLTFLGVFARPMLRDLVNELFEEREQT